MRARAAYAAAGTVRRAVVVATVAAAAAGTAAAEQQREPHELRQLFNILMDDLRLFLDVTPCSPGASASGIFLKAHSRREADFWTRYHNHQMQDQHGQFITSAPLRSTHFQTESGTHETSSRNADECFSRYLCSWFYGGNALQRTSVASTDIARWQ